MPSAASRRSSQFVLQEFARPTVGKVIHSGVIVFSVNAGGKEFGAVSLEAPRYPTTTLL
jgi:hypothetical protein